MTDEARVTVIGAGTMGHGIAQLAAMNGARVNLKDVSSDVLKSAMESIRRDLDVGVQKGKVDEIARDQAMDRITPTTDPAFAYEGAQWVIEAVPEDLELKRRVLQEAEAAAPQSCRLATNTSSLSITRLAQSMQDPGRLVGMHFFNPASRMPLVEVVRGQASDPDVVDACMELAKGWGKDPIVVRDAPGFASSRLGLVLGLEAIRMLEQGVASAADIDKAMELGYRHPMGPLKLTDLVGLDVRLNIAEYLHQQLGSDSFAPPDLLRSMVADGNLGRKTGKGFYSYTGQS